MKRILVILFHRVTLTVLFMLLQLGLIIGMVVRFNQYFVYFYGFSILLSALILLEIINNRVNPAYKIAWIIPVLIFPVFGGFIYLMFGHDGLTRREKQQMGRVQTRIMEITTPDGVSEQLRERSRTAATQSRYMSEYAYCPPCRCTHTEYFPLGELAFSRMKQDMLAAERYIFLEYFIVEQGVMWSEILEILQQKVAEGVDCRLIYDDMGSIFKLPYGYHRTLEEMGIRCLVFNPFRPVLSSRFNNRSHRKLASMDGKVAYTGGINLADEYINAYEKLGHWKDTVLRVEGDAAWYMTAGFLSMWDYLDGNEHDLLAYRPALPLPGCESADGFVQPYSDSPLDGESVGETVYMNLIYKARRYVYITTPYLIADNKMTAALCTAAKCGVDVRIITPHVADKWYVHAVTRHNYLQLVESGVRIFEYTPGFMHAKSFVADDEYGIVGTVNLDFRSLYLHFENGVWMYGTESVAQILDDFKKTERLSLEITEEMCKSVPFYRRLGRSILSVFSPLM